MAVWDLFGGAGGVGGVFGLVDLVAQAREDASIGQVTSTSFAGGTPVPSSAQLGLPSIFDVQNVASYQPGSSVAVPPSVDLPPPDYTPPSQNVPEPPIGGGSSGDLPLPPPATVLPFGLGGSSSLGALRPSSDTASEKRIRAERDRFARALGLKVRKKKTTTNALAARLARRVTVDVLKKIEMPAILRSVTAGAGVLLPRVLGPVVGAISIGSMLPEGTTAKVKDAILNAYGRPGGQQQAAAKRAADALQPIKVTAKKLPGGTAAANKVLDEYKRGIYEAVPRQIPKYKPPAAAPKPTALQRLLNPNPKTLANVKALGAALDKLRKKAAPAAIDSPSLPALPATPTITNTPGITNIPGTTYYPIGSALTASSRVSSSSSACSCGPKKKRGPARKCLERAAVVYKTGRYKGKAAGSRCIRFAT
jgi:hypothetical protein